MDKLSNKVALVTGGIRGIGREIVLKLGKAGVDLLINDIRTAGSAAGQIQTLLAELHGMGRKAHFVHADISEKSSVKELLSKTHTLFGHLDFLILNAAQAPFKPLERLLERDLRQLVGTNFFGNIYCIQESIPLLEQTAGKIIFISSLGSRFANPSYPLGSMKAAMETIVRDCAVSFKDKNISVNAVCGGIVLTDSYKVLRQHWDNLEDVTKDFLIQPSEIADVVVFLCSPQSTAIQGQTLIADKGLSNSLFHIKDNRQ